MISRRDLWKDFGGNLPLTSLSNFAKGTILGKGFAQVQVNEQLVDISQKR